MKPITRIFINSLIQILFFSLFSALFWNKSGGDMGLIFVGISFWIFHLLVSFRWVVKFTNIFFHIFIGLLIAGALNVLSFNLQNYFRHREYNQEEIIIEKNQSIDIIN